MKRPPRPFTVEIKSSRRPANSRTLAPALVDRPRTEPLFQDLLLRDSQHAGQERRPAQGAALSEAYQLFRRLGVSTPGSAQAADRLTLAQDNLEGKAAAREPLRSATARLEPRPGRVLPDLLSLSPAGAPLSPEAEKHSAPRSPKVRERVKPEGAETLRDRDQAYPLDADHERRERIEMEALTPPDPPERAAAEQGRLPTSSSPEITTSSELGSSRPDRHSREVWPGWMYRAACRKAKRRGKALPQRTGATWKRR